MKSKIIFLFAAIFFQFSHAKEYVGIDICSKFNLSEFSTYLKRSHNTESITKSKIGDSYEFYYKINEEEYKVKLSLYENLIFEVDISPFLQKNSKLRRMLVKKYGYGKSVTEKNVLGDMRYVISYLKLNDPEVRLYTSKFITADGVSIADESITYQCASIADKKSEKEKKAADELKKNKPKMTF
jgi:hypothetical protein